MTDYFDIILPIQRVYENQVKAKSEFEKHQVVSNRLCMPDFDKYILESENNVKNDAYFGDRKIKNFIRLPYNINQKANNRRWNIRKSEA